MNMWQMVAPLQGARPAFSAPDASNDLHLIDRGAPAGKSPTFLGGLRSVRAVAQQRRIGECPWAWTHARVLPSGGLCSVGTVCATRSNLVSIIYSSYRTHRPGRSKLDRR